MIRKQSKEGVTPGKTVTYEYYVPEQSGQLIVNQTVLGGYTNLQQTLFRMQMLDFWDL